MIEWNCCECKTDLRNHKPTAGCWDEPLTNETEHYTWERVFVALNSTRRGVK